MATFLIILLFFLVRLTLIFVFWIALFYVFRFVYFNSTEIY